MVRSEKEIRQSIANLEERLKFNEFLYPKADTIMKSRIMTSSLNIESQLSALYYTLGEEYKYKYKSNDIEKNY